MTESTVAEDILHVELHGAAAVLRLNRPSKHNALSRRLVERISDAIEDCAADPHVRAILLTGNDKAFSTGVDLSEAVAVTTEADYLSVSATWRRLTDQIETSATPVVACISGYCLTGGLEIAMACDFRIAESTAVLGMTSARIGSVAGIGATQRLPRLVGPSRAKMMLFTAEFINGDEALRIGLVDQVTEAGRALDAGLELAEKIAATAPLSARWHKEAVNRGVELPLSEALGLEAQFSMQAFMTADKKEGMSAFLERRSPRFSGE